MRCRFLFALLLATGVRAQSRHVGPFDADAERSTAKAADAPGTEDEGEEAENDLAESESPEVETRAPQGGLGPEIRYTSDLATPELQRRWMNDVESLGSISVGFADNGRLINAVHMPEDEAWICRRSDLAWGTQETVDALALAFRAVHQQFPRSAPARLSHIGAQDGGSLRPHRSHQSGRDADIGFFYKTDVIPPPGVRRERLLDPARNWALLKALVTQTDVQVILVDRAINRVLHSYALSSGEDASWLERVFVGRTAIVQHATHHRDHFHVRF
jgi:murein endopeptidase